MKSGEDLDNIFKKGLDDPANHRAFNEDDWDSLEQMLDKGKKRRGIVYWLPIASSIAALLLLFLGWWMFKPTVIDKPVKQQASVKKPVEQQWHPATSGGATQQPIDSSNQKIQPAESLAAGVNASTGVNAGQQFATSSADGARRNVAGGNGGANRAGGMLNKDTLMLRDTLMIASTHPAAKGRSVDDMLAGRAQSLDITQQPLQTAALSDFDTQLYDKQTSDGSEDKKMSRKIKREGFAYSRPLAITAIASSDVNGTNAFQGKVGSNYGALFSFGVSKKFTITSGVVYSSKPYSTSFAEYHTAYTFKHEPNSVTADCRMLDIPINIGYQVYGNMRNKLSVGTGMSSYIMLHENYTYDYGANNNPAWPQSYTVPNSKSYLLSIVNINATYERRINAKFSLSVQPYLKVPISGVGYSDIKLESTGVAVGVNWNFGSFGKH